MTPFKEKVGDVWIVERPEKGGRLYLRTRTATVPGAKRATGWKWQSLGLTARTSGGRLIQAAIDRARVAARELPSPSLTTSTTSAAPSANGAPPKSLALTSTSALIFDSPGCLYPHPTQHRSEVERALRLAVQTWGADKSWETLTRADWRALWRASLAASKASGRARSGARAAEIVTSRMATVARHLVEEGHVGRIVLPPKDWRQQVRADVAALTGREPEPHRPRHTLTEMRAILEAAQYGDPRFFLLLMLGAELRLGQVVRCRRSDLNLTAGTLRVPSRGRKRGVTVVLTPGQVGAAAGALAGVLAPLEATGEDFPLFPSGQLPGGRSGKWTTDPARHLAARPVGRRWVLAQFLAVERRAGVPHVEGRGAYGLRRAAVDGVKQLGISREGLQAHGGWSDLQVPDLVYAEQEQEWARREAAEKRAILRGEEAVA